MGLQSKVPKAFGSLSLENSLVKLGSTTQVSISSVPAATALSAGATTVTAAALLTGVVTQAASSALTLTAPAFAAFSAAIPNLVAGDSFDFTIINTSGSNIITFAVDASATLEGAAAIAVSSSANFRFRSTGSAYVVYRV
jgi:hypothetical protein